MNKQTRNIFIALSSISIIVGIQVWRGEYFLPKRNVATEAENDGTTKPEFPTIYTSKSKLEANIVYKAPSRYGEITVFDYDNVRCFLIDGANESCWNFNNQRPSEYVDDIAYLMEETVEGKDILVIGMGAGTLLKRINGTDYKVDAVEINPVMEDVANDFFVLPKNLTYNVIIDDGRHYIANNDKKYDAIILDICSVNSANAHLWTKEFFEIVKHRLKDPKTGVVIASRGVVNTDEMRELDHMIANASKLSFDNLYEMHREEDPDEYDVSVFLLTDKNISPDNLQPYPFPLNEWEFQSEFEATTDKRLDEMVALFQPANEKIREQVVANFGEDILLPHP